MAFNLKLCHCCGFMLRSRFCVSKACRCARRPLVVTVTAVTAVTVASHSHSVPVTVTACGGHWLSVTVVMAVTDPLWSVKVTVSESLWSLLAVATSLLWHLPMATVCRSRAGLWSLLAVATSLLWQLVVLTCQWQPAVGAAGSGPPSRRAAGRRAGRPPAATMTAAQDWHRAPFRQAAPASTVWGRPGARAHRPSHAAAGALSGRAPARHRHPRRRGQRRARSFVLPLPAMGRDGGDAGGRKVLEAQTGPARRAWLRQSGSANRASRPSQRRRAMAWFRRLGAGRRGGGGR